MPMSELSDALNPHAVRERLIPHATPLDSPLQPILSTPREQHHAPHRSELELAFTEPAPPQVQPLQLTHPRMTPDTRLDAVHHLLRIVASTKQATDIERTRREAWEQEQDARQRRQQAETAGQLLDLQQDISKVKAYLSLLPYVSSRNSAAASGSGAETRTNISDNVAQSLFQASFNSRHDGLQDVIAVLRNGGESNVSSQMISGALLALGQEPCVSRQSDTVRQHELSNATPLSHEDSTTVSPANTPNFHGILTPSSTPGDDLHARFASAYTAPYPPPRPFPSSRKDPFTREPLPLLNQPARATYNPSYSDSLHAVASRPVSSPISPFPSAAISSSMRSIVCTTTAEPPTLPLSTDLGALSQRSGRKRKPRSLNYASDLNTSADDEDSDSSMGYERRQRRRGPHDKNVYTIQHAMRKHIISSMAMMNSSHLPPSHLEGAPVSEDAPVRFVWEATPLKSAHNALMRERVVYDLRESGEKLYPHVPAFNFKDIAGLERAFDQAFATLRSKYKAQNDASVAGAMRKSEEKKAQKARRIVRKRQKLEARAMARDLSSAYRHATFDGAFHLECMSSEESSCEASDHDGFWRVGSSPNTLHVHAPAWRSVRLSRFLEALDQTEGSTSWMTKTTKGAGTRREREKALPRVRGKPREGVGPPTGIQRWMISERWVSSMKSIRAPEEVETRLKEVLYRPEDFDESYLDALGQDSEQEMGERAADGAHERMRGFLIQ